MRIDGASVGDGTAISSVATRAVGKQIEADLHRLRKNASAARLMLGSVVVEQQRLQRVPRTGQSQAAWYVIQVSCTPPSAQLEKRSEKFVAKQSVIAWDLIQPCRRTPD